MGKTGTIVEFSDMFFEDDFKIDTSKISNTISIPVSLPVLSIDELTILYMGKIYFAYDDIKPEDKNHIKIYTKTLALRDGGSTKKYEEEYFKNNAALIDKLKKDFMNKVVIPDSNIPASVAANIAKSIGEELKRKILAHYDPIIKSLEKSLTEFPEHKKGSLTMLKDDSLLNKYFTLSRRSLILEDRVYTLLTFKEYLVKFEESIEPKFYESTTKLLESKNLTPEEFTKYLDDNSDNIHPKAFPRIKNKIRHSDRSSRLFLDGIYWIPEYYGNISAIVDSYKSMIEMKIKVESTGLRL
jgi:hypothetical protein